MAEAYGSFSSQSADESRMTSCHISLVLPSLFFLPLDAAEASLGSSQLLSNRTVSGVFIYLGEF